jgi:hypothetical protein
MPTTTSPAPTDWKTMCRPTRSSTRMKKKPSGKMTTQAASMMKTWPVSAKSQSAWSPRFLVPMLLTRPSGGAPRPAAAVMSMVNLP